MDVTLAGKNRRKADVTVYLCRTCVKRAEKNGIEKVHHYKILQDLRREVATVVFKV